jgi:signal transduction histidine kinase/DNA-binding response OmpR family regulator
VALEADGYRVLTASDGETALTHLVRQPVGLVVQDFLLPDMDGSALLSALRALPNGKDIPVLVVSGFKTLLTQLHCGPEGFTAALLKPVRPSTLVENVRRYLPLPLPACGDTAATRGKTILLVDDDPLQLRLARFRLEHAGFEVVSVADGAEAIAACTRQVPDAILCDVLMPETDGYELCLALRSTAAFAHVPVVLVSAYYSGARDEELARSVGASALVMRTPELEGVITALCAALTHAPDQNHTSHELSESQHAERVIAQLKRQARTNAGFAEKSALQAVQLSILAGISEALLRSGTTEALDDLLSTCLDAGGISRAALYRVSPDHELVLSRAIGFSEAAAYALEDAFGCGPRLMQASQHPVVSVRACLSEAEVRELFAAAAVAEAVLIPFSEEHHCVGALLLGSDSKEMTERDLLVFARAIAAQIAQASALAESFSRLREGEEAGRVLSASLDLEQTLSSLGRLATTRLADVCEVRLGTAAPRIFTGHLGRPAQLGLKSQIVVPLVAHRQSLGTVTFARARPGLPFSLGDRRSAEDLVTRAATAIDNAILYQSAKGASRMKDEFLATLSHELRTPLTSILGWARMLTRGIAVSKHPQAFRVIERCALAQARLIDDLLDTSRVISGGMRLEMQPTDLMCIIDAVLQSALPAMQARHMEVRRSVPQAGMFVAGDPLRLQQIVWNLLSNAMKFTPPGGSVDINVAEVNAQVVLSISDDGEGIAAESLGSVFDRFTQGEGARVRSHGGLGLGLAITRHLVELHGGTISAYSEGKGRGARFTLTLPMAPAPALKTGAAIAILPLAPRPELESVTALVVSDDADARELLLAMLEECGVAVMGAASVAEGFVLLASGRPNMLLCDAEMLGEDGYTMIHHLRALPIDQGGAIPAGAMSAHTLADDRALAFSAGYQAHLAKPIVPEELIEAVIQLHALCAVASNTSVAT